jgi:hypothetical protein
VPTVHDGARNEELGCRKKSPERSRSKKQCKEEIVFVVLRDALVKGFIQFAKMIGHPSPRKKHFLILTY